MDVLARLKLAADEFATETDRQFGAFRSKGAAAARDVNASFASSLGEVQKLTAKALAIPRNAGGSLDLSAEIAQLRAGAQAADQKAAAHFELRAAMQAAEQAGTGNIAVLRAEAAAAAVAGANEEKLASQMRQRVVTLEAVQAELNKMTSATGSAIVINERHAASAGQQRQSMMMAGQQLQDFFVQVNSGQSVMTAFIQQFGQAAFAVQGMGGSMAGVAKFLTSTWGIFGTVAVVALTPFVAKLLEGNDALDKAVEKLRKDAEEARVTGEANRIFARTIEGLTAAIREQNVALGKEVEAHRDARRAALDAATAREREIAGIRDLTAARLSDALAAKRALDDSAVANTDPRAAAVARRVRDQEIAALETKLAAAETAAAAARSGLGTARTLFAIEQGQRAADPIKRINDQYDAQVQKLRQVKAGTQEVADAIARQVAQIERRRAAALKDAQAAQSAANRAPIREFGREVSSAEAASIARSAGLQVNSADRSTRRQTELYNDWIAAGRPKDNPVARPGTSAHERGNGLDIQMTAGVTVQKIKDAFAAEGVRLTKVFAERGHWHVEWKRSAAAVQAQKDATKDQHDLKAALEDVTRRFDPARSAADEYAKVLRQIDQLETGKTITAGQAQGFRFSAMMEDLAKSRAGQLDGWKKALGDAPDIFSGVDGYDRGQSSKWEKASDDLIEGQRRKAETAIRDLSDLYYDLFDNRSGNIWDGFSRRALGVISDVAAQQTLGFVFGKGGSAGDAPADAGNQIVGELKKLNISIPGLPKGLSDRLAKDVLPGAGIGALGGGAFAAITGRKNDTLASGIGGALGGVAGKELGKVAASAIGGTLGKALGGAAGPIGSVLGGILGNVVGGLFAKTPKGSAGITVNQYGQIASTSASGTTKEAKAGAATMAGAVANGLNQVAEQLGAKITGMTDVQIGIYKDKFRVNTTGGAIGGVKGSGALSFDTQEDAIAFAIADALKDGVLSGISAASQSILRSGQGLQAAMQKALLIEAVPRDLKAMLDPLGAAVDDLNRKFQKTVDALKEGGASAEQMAQAQRLYDLQLEQVKASTVAASATLKDFQQALNAGSNSPLSLRDQEASALGQLQPFLDRIAAGQSIDQSKYQQAAQGYLDIERQLYGSTDRYFAAFDSIQAATARAIATIDNAVPIGTGAESPFAKATAAAAEKTAAGVQTGNEMAEDTNALLQQAVGLLQQVAANGGGGGGGSFIGADRLYRLNAA